MSDSCTTYLRLSMNLVLKTTFGGNRNSYLQFTIGRGKQLRKGAVGLEPVLILIGLNVLVDLLIVEACCLGACRLFP